MKLNNEKLYRYYYLEKGNEVDRPLIIYSESNLLYYINQKNFGKILIQKNKKILKDYFLKKILKIHCKIKHSI